MTLPNILLCNPDDPRWIHGPSMTAMATAPWCGHPIKVSAAGVGVLLSTPGLKTCCWYCIPGDIDPDDFRVLPEIAEYFEEVSGEKLSPQLVEKMKRAAITQARRNRRQ